MTITVNDLVAREVHYCVSSLVSLLAANMGAVEMSEASRSMEDAAEQAWQLASPIDDWEEAAREAGWTEFEHPEGHGLRNVKLDRDWPNVDWQAAAEDAGIDEPYQREVFEHWIVSDWLADRLAEKGEKVDKDFAGMTVWARTTTGQQISADHVIEQIHADLVRS